MPQVHGVGGWGPVLQLPAARAFVLCLLRLSEVSSPGLAACPNSSRILGLLTPPTRPTCTHRFRSLSLQLFPCPFLWSCLCQSPSPSFRGPFLSGVPSSPSYLGCMLEAAGRGEDGGGQLLRAQGQAACAGWVLP